MNQLIKAVKFTERIAQKVMAHTGMELSWLIFTPSDDGTIKGECKIQRYQQNMHICIFLPWNLKFDEKTKADIIAVTVHEFAHFEHACHQNPSDRVLESHKYVTNGDYRRYDERRTWKRAKKLMQELHLWTDKVRRRCRTYAQANGI